MACQAQAAELRSVNSARLESVGTVEVSPPEEVAEVVVEARLAAERCSLLRLRRRYLSGS